MTSKVKQYRLYHLLFGLLVIFFVLHRVNLWSPPSPEPKLYPGGFKEDPPDIWYIYQWAVTLKNGSNPYAIWLTEEATTKSISYFPLYILIGQIPMYLGFSTYEAWASAMRPIHLFATLGIGLILYKLSLMRQRPALGILGSAMWFFNFITIKVWEIQQIESIAIFFALLALYYADSKPNHAGFLLGGAIGIKLIMLFIVPIYLLIRIHNEKATQNRIQTQILGILFSIFYIILIPLVISLPFLFWNYQSYFMGILAEGASGIRWHIIGRYADAYYDILIHLNFGGLLSKDTIMSFLRIPLILVLIIFYIIYWIKRVDEYLLASFVFASYIYFNPVVFIQYFIWPIPFILASIISKDYEIQTSSIDLKNKPRNVINKPKQLKRTNNILFVVLMILAVFSYLYYVFRHLSFQMFSILISNLGIGIIIYKIANKNNLSFLGIVGAAFWLFNQETLYILSLQLNLPISLFFTVLAIYLLEDEPDKSKLLMGAAIVIHPLVLIFTPLFLIGPGVRIKRPDIIDNGRNTNLQIKYFLISLGYLLIIPLSLYPLIKTDYKEFFEYFLNRSPYLVVMVSICLIITFFHHRNEVDRFAYAALAAILLFTFTANKFEFFPFSWFVFVILYAVGGGFTHNNLPEFKEREKANRS